MQGGSSTTALRYRSRKGLSQQLPVRAGAPQVHRSTIGEGSTDTLDFAKIALSNNNLFSRGTDTAECGLCRFRGRAIPLDALATCAGFNYNYLLRNTEVHVLRLPAAAERPRPVLLGLELDARRNGQWQQPAYLPVADNSGTYFLTR